MTIREKLQEGEDYLQKKEIENANYDAKELMLFTLNMSDADFFLGRNKDITNYDATRYDEYIKRRGEHEPLQHITGIAYFYGRKFMVNNKVLIPRFDTENLVERVLKLIKKDDHVLDMCTGSGCIIETIALESECSKENNACVGVDISSEALKVANANKEKLNAKGVTLIKSDLFENLNKELINSFDIIVSNPPYIPTGVIEGLSKEVKLFDPMLALDGDNDGLKFYIKITKECRNFLKLGGYLAFEIGHDQAEQVSKIMQDNGFYNINVYKDLSGFDRVIIGKYGDGQ